MVLYKVTGLVRSGVYLQNDSQNGQCNFEYFAYIVLDKNWKFEKVRIFCCSHFTC